MTESLLDTAALDDPSLYEDDTDGGLDWADQFEADFASEAGWEYLDALV